MRVQLLFLLAPFFALHAQDGRAVRASIEKPPTDCLYRLAEDFVPMTRSERIAEATTALATSPTPFIYTAIRSGIDQAHSRPREWGNDAEGFGLRYRSIFGEHIISQTVQFGLSYTLHEDNRYFASGKQKAARRFGYAIASTGLARHDDGSRTISVSAIAGAAGAAFISRAWQPRSTMSAGDAAVSFGLTMGTRAAMNVLREFSPRFLGRILR